MSRFLPHSLAGRTIMTLILGLVATHVATVVIFERHRNALLTRADEQHIVRHIASISDVVLNVPGDVQDRVVSASDNHTFRVSVTRAAPAPKGGAESAQANRLGEMVTHSMRTELGEPVHVEIGAAGALVASPDAGWIPDGLRSGIARLFTGHDPGTTLLVSVPLPEGERLDFATALPLAVAPGWPRVVAMTGIFLLVVLLLSVWAVRRLLMPVRRFAGATTAFAHDIHTPALPETGPSELRETARAFNEMQRRIIRLLESRTQMLAAISHDLRTPLTTIRLRAETIEDAEIRCRILSTLAEMDRMLAATLSFARAGAECEPISMTDLGALLGAICDDLSEMGHDVICTAEDEILLPCRPVALRRALVNLIDNAGRYGRKARVRVGLDAGTPTITIEDEGPGIPPDEMERVFLPFHRLEGSRSRDTGGIGLGMAIAKTIIDSHAGGTALANREGGGLQVRVRLPFPEPPAKTASQVPRGARHPNSRA